MRRFILFLLAITLFAPFAFGQGTNPDSIQFIVVRLDFLSYGLKYIYYFTQPYELSPPQEGEMPYGMLYVKIVPAGDFGGTTIRSSETGQVVYDATTVWDGTGKHFFPTEKFIVPPGDPGPNIDHPTFFDTVKTFYWEWDSTKVDTVWKVVKTIAPVSRFTTEKFGVLIYFHFFSVGMSDPSTAEWIVIFYSLPEISSQGRWVSITGDLPNLHVNSIAHSFYTDYLFIGTDAGAFQTSDGGQHWERIHFGENPEVRVTQIRAEHHPPFSWPEPVLWLGTEEYTPIPEDRLGRIFFSPRGGLKWEDTHFPNVAVSALEVPLDFPLTRAYAAAYNPFYNQDGFYTWADSVWQEYDFTPGDTTAIRINCIEVDELDHNRIFLATSEGIFATIDGGKNWIDTFKPRNMSWVAMPPISWMPLPAKPAVYAVLSCGSRSDGIYRSWDYGKTWELVCWQMNVVALVPNFYDYGVWYMAVKDQGVFKSSNNCSTWVDISEGLPCRDVLCLAPDRRNAKVLYAGTTKGIFRHEEVPTAVEQEEETAERVVPKGFELYPAYPNPFNSVTVIRFDLPEQSMIQMEIYNLLGQRVRTLVAGEKQAGRHTVLWEGTDDGGRLVASGIYLCRLSISNDKYLASQKIILLR